MSPGRAVSQVVGLVCLVVACLAQTPASEQSKGEMTSHDGPVTFSTAVNLVLVPVVVRDSNGKAIGTLHKEDFQLFDKGKQRVIARFSIDKLESPPILPDTSLETDANGNPIPQPGEPEKLAVAEHFVSLIFADVHLAFGDLAQAQAAANHLLVESFEPGTRAAIYTTSGRTVLDFTDDKG